MEIEMGFFASLFHNEPPKKYLPDAEKVFKALKNICSKKMKGSIGVFDLVYEPGWHIDKVTVWVDGVLLCSAFSCRGGDYLDLAEVGEVYCGEVINFLEAVVAAEEKREQNILANDVAKVAKAMEGTIK